MPFTIKRNDTSPVIQTTLTDPLGNAIDLTGATVRFHMKKYRASVAKIDQPVTIVDEDAGVVRYQWQSGDTDTVGSYQAEFEVSFIDGTVETFPNADFIQIDVIYDLA